MQSARIGIDFGTTNSVVYHYDQRSGPQLTIVPGSDSSGIIPTVVNLRSEKRRRTQIGKPAKDSPDGSTKERFKLMLPGAGETFVQRSQNSDFAAAKEFLTELIEQFMRENQLEAIDHIALTVPETWLLDPLQKGAGALHQVFRQAKQPRPRLISEPVAAACYFTHKQSQETGNPYNGYAFIYDHGGGTLDVTFVKIDGAHVSRIDGIGFGENISKQGLGGAAFDHLVLSRLADEQPALRSLSPLENTIWLKNFDEAKRSASPQIEDAFVDFSETNDYENEYLFDVGGTETSRVSIYTDHMFQPLTQNFWPNIDEPLSQFIASCLRENPDADIETASNVRFVMVGGFSGFAPIRMMVKKKISEEFNAPKLLFKDYFDQHERWTAISRGASLVAGQAVKVPESIPLSIGLVTYNLDGEEQYEYIMRRGEEMSGYRALNPVFHSERITISCKSKSTTAPLVLFTEKSGKKSKLQVIDKLASILPDIESAQFWRVGVRIDSADRAVMTFRSNLGNKKHIRLGDLIGIAEGEIIGQILE